MESRGFYSSRQFYNNDVTNDRCCNHPHCSSYNYDVTNIYHDNIFKRDNRNSYNFPKREIPKYENRPHHVTEHVTSSRIGGENLKIESSFESGQLAKNNEPLFESGSKLIKKVEQDDQTDLRFSFVY